jgi:hypothetical protein
VLFRAAPSRPCNKKPRRRTASLSLVGVVVARAYPGIVRGALPFFNQTKYMLTAAKVR